MKTKLLENLKEAGVKMTGSWAAGKEWDFSVVLPGMDRQKGRSDFDFYVTSDIIPKVIKILEDSKIEWRYGRIDNKPDPFYIVTKDTYPQMEFSPYFEERADRLQTVDVYGTVFETH